MLINAAIISNDVKMICSFEMFSFMSDVEDNQTHGFVFLLCIRYIYDDNHVCRLRTNFTDGILSQGDGSLNLFFLFVEGKAASPDVSKVLETIPAG